MKRFFTFLFISISLFSFAQEEGARIAFEEEIFEFGTIAEGPKVTHEFVFTNNGSEALVLSNVKASCGCTVPEWPREPVMPGESSSIMVTYNTAKRVGNFNKAITVTSNATNSASKIIYIKGNVEAAPEEETMPVKEPLMMAPSTE